ncbi:MAG: pilus assembly protein [Candidatus Binataceae bacterium]|nr:pilus assembly protein [Candidatus Binataceae bacterium]
MAQSLNVSRRGNSLSGQSTVEFAIIAVVAMFVLFLGIQFALLGNAALAVGQLAYQGSRYASINSSLPPSTLQNNISAMASPTIAGNGLTVNVTFQTPIVQTVTSVTVQVTFSAQRLILLPNPFFGVPFPSTLSSTNIALVD